MQFLQPQVTSKRDTRVNSKLIWDCYVKNILVNERVHTIPTITSYRVHKAVWPRFSLNVCKGHIMVSVKLVWDIDVEKIPAMQPYIEGCKYFVIMVNTTVKMEWPLENGIHLRKCNEFWMSYRSWNGKVLFDRDKYFTKFPTNDQVQLKHFQGHPFLKGNWSWEDAHVLWKWALNVMKWKSAIWCWKIFSRWPIFERDLTKW